MSRNQQTYAQDSFAEMKMCKSDEGRHTDVQRKRGAKLAFSECLLWIHAQNKGKMAPSELCFEDGRKGNKGSGVMGVAAKANAQKHNHTILELC